MDDLVATKRTRRIPKTKEPGMNRLTLFNERESCPRSRRRARGSGRLRICAVASLAAASVVFAACGGSDTKSSSKKQTLTIASSFMCSDIADITTGIPAASVFIAYEPLIRYHPDGKLHPGLATSWEIEPGNKTITLNLRKDARFSDGTPVTANAVKTWLEYRDTVVSPYDFKMGDLKSVDAVSRYVVRVTTKEPNPTIDEALSNKVGSNWGLVVNPKAIARVKANPKSNFLKQNSAGAGPWVLDPKQTVVNDHCTYVPNKHYFDKDAIKWSKVVQRFITDPNTMLAAMKTGQVDMGEGDSSTVDAAKAAGLKVIHTPGRLQGIYFLDKSGKTEPALANEQVRQALNYAIDRKKITASIFGEDAQPTSNPNPTSDGDDSELSNYYSYDPKKAKDLLTQAGYPNGFTMNVIARGAWQAPFKTTPLAQAVAKDLAAVGVKVNVKSTASLAEYQDALGSNKYSADSVIFGTNPTWQWYGLAMRPGGAIADRSGWTDPASDKLWKQGSVADPEAEGEIWKQLMRRTIEKAFFLPILSPGLYTYVSTDVDGVEQTPDGSASPADGWTPAQ